MDQMFETHGDEFVGTEGEYQIRIRLPHPNAEREAKSMLDLMTGRTAERLDAMLREFEA